MRVREWSVILSLALGVLGAGGCTTVPEIGQPPTALAAPNDAASPQPIQAADRTPEPSVGWTAYTHLPTGLSIRYPSTWYGPEVYEFEDGVRLEVGSDVVYPYGTGLDERQPGAPNAYSVVIQYTRHRAGWTLEQYRAEQPWLEEMLDVLNMRDGETAATARSLTTRMRGLDVGRFTGVEFVTTLPDTAQTEHVYMRTAWLMDENLDMLVVRGSPENVEVTDPANWKAAYEAVESAYLGIFQEIVASIELR